MNPPLDKLSYEFGGFRLDTERHRLVHNDANLPLTHNAVEVLRVLIERRGQVVEREELMNAVWPDVTVEDGNLSVAVSMLRKVLNEHSPEKFIETFPKRGYKFVGEVQEVFEPVHGMVVAKQTVGRVVIEEEFRLNKSALKRLGVDLFKTSRRRAIAATVTATAVIAGLGAWVYVSRNGSERSRTPRVQSIAVLPFKAINPDKEGMHQGLGLADLLITRLSNIKAITVRPTSSVTSLENSEEDSISIANKLGVDAVLEGTIYQSGDRVRVTGRLIRVSDQTAMWSGQFERSMKDELGLQNEIALQVVDALALNLSGDEERALKKRYTEDPEALQLYLKGRYNWNKRSQEGLSQATYLFRKAIEADPRFALAYVGLADSYIFAAGSPSEVESALQKALELDPNLGEAYASKGFLLSVHYWRWREAEECFKKSIELNPGYPTAHHWYATLLGIQGRYDEAKAEMNRALDINPMSHNFLADLGQIYYFNHEYEKAKEYCDRALAIYPDFTFAHGYLANIQLKRGEYESFIEEKLKAILILNTVGKKPADAAQEEAENLAKDKEHYRKGGLRGFFEHELTGVGQQPVTRDPNEHYGLGVIYAILENEDKALDSLEKALENRAFMMAWVKAEPIFDNLRKHARFKAILQKMDLPPDA